MALYRCAACGSSRIVVDTKKEGYDIKKGLLGRALLGSGGALAGINGQTNTYYHCTECGQVLSYTMSQTQKFVIDYAFEHKELSTNMEELENLKKQYPGIEWNEMDSRKARKILNSKVENITEEIVSECIDFIMKKGTTSHDELANYLASEGYGTFIIRESKTKIAWKENISIKLILRDNKLFYEVCYAENASELRGNNILTVQRYNEFEKQERFQSRCSEIENAIISALSKCKEPIKVSDMEKYYDSELCYSMDMLNRGVKGLCEKGLVQKTVIDRKAYFSLVKKETN